MNIITNSTALPVFSAGLPASGGLCSVITGSSFFWLAPYVAPVETIASEAPAHQMTTLETGNTTLETKETTQEKIVNLIRENPQITRKEMALLVGLTLGGLKYHLAKMEKAGVITHVGATKRGRWQIIERK